MKYIIYGTGNYGRNAYETLKDKINIVGFSDPFTKQVQFSTNGLPVLFPDEINRDCISIIATGHRYWKDIEKKLDSLQIKHITYDKLIFDMFRPELESVYSLLSDELSKKTLDEVIKARTIGDSSGLRNVYCDNQYFAIPEILTKVGGREWFIDAGAYVGDMVEKYIIDRVEHFDKIFAFEPATKQFNALKIRAKRLTEEWALRDDAIQCIKAGLSDKSKVIKIMQGNVPGGTFITETNENNSDYDILQAYSLDDFIEESSYELNGKIGFIKADIEGEEIKLLKGSVETIKKYKPRLAICLYHNPFDFIRIPLYIKELCPDYKMVIRHHTFEFDETVLYCYI